ncbi:MAG: hypothetical protein AAF585_00695 [Verrucomicrobiota bacterium]
MIRLLASTALLIAIAALASCESGSDYDPYGVNSGGYYGSDLESMNHNLLTPDSVGR